MTETDPTPSWSPTPPVPKQWPAGPGWHCANRGWFTDAEPAA
ncbi:MAG TPA: hypothetical protein VNO83_05195 [Pseudonocardia sp.]|nr:hypothetical protein [Pseudonocardia sp.]